MRTKISPGEYRMDSQEATSSEPAYEGVIYKLLCDDGHYYFGSTKTELKCRLYAHKTAAIRHYDRKVYKYINEYGWDKTKIILVEKVSCSCRQELVKKENEYIKPALGDPKCLNENKALLTKDELLEQQAKYKENNKDTINAYHATYRIENAEKRRAYSKKYSEEHREQVKAARKKYYETNKEAILESCKKYSEANKDKIAASKAAWTAENQEKVKEWQRRYAEENKDAISKKGKEYYQANKEEIRKKFKQYQVENREKCLEYSRNYREANREKMYVQHQCPCGGTYVERHKDRHTESKKHQTYLATTTVPSPSA
jgi:hypothetical protein